MSIAVLTQVYDEAKRLAVAGSLVAAGDFRLKKLIPPLQKAGEKAPVFAKVAQAAQAVVDSDDKTASTALLELTSLVNAILYTQGETGIAGELQPIESTDLGARQTQTSARVLKPLLEALTSTGSGRLEVIRDAFERGVFLDLRLVKPALQALDDPYGEVADLIAESVLPVYGKAIVGELLARLNIKGKAKGGEVRALRLMHHLDPAAARDRVKQALDDGSKEMKVAAIECLGDADEDLSYLLEQARAKAGDVRAAALRALATRDRENAEAVDALKKGIDGPDLDAIIDRVRECRLPAIHEHVLEQAEKRIGEALKSKDKKEQGVSMLRLQHLLLCLAGRTDAPTEAFLLQCFERRDDLAKVKSAPVAGTDTNELLASLLSEATPMSREVLIAAHQSLPAGMLGSVFHAARRILPPARVFDMFAGDLSAASQKRTKKSAAEVDRAQVLVEALAADNDRAYGYGYGRYGRYNPWARRAFDRETRTPLPELDPRWLDAAVEARHLGLVHSLARPDHPGTLKFLSEEFAERSKKKDDPYTVNTILDTMVQVRHPDAADSIIEFIRLQSKATHIGYYTYYLNRLIPALPKSELPKFEALLPTLPEKMVDQLMEPVLALKNKTE
jgi:hypothetical protein